MEEEIKRNLDYIFDGIDSKVIDLMEDEGVAIDDDSVEKYLRVALRAKLEEFSG